MCKCNKNVFIKWMKIHPDAVIPSYAHSGDAGFDLHAIENVIVPPFERTLVKTGLKIEIPSGYEMQIRPRSGVSLKTPLIIPNSPGTIDSGYRGEVCILIANISRAPFEIKKGARIAQGVIKEVPTVVHMEVSELSETNRGEGGFGSTG